MDTAALVVRQGAPGIDGIDAEFGSRSSSAGWPIGPPRDFDGGRGYPVAVISNEVQRTQPFFGAQHGGMWRSGGGWGELMAALAVIPMDLGREPGTGLAGPPRLIGDVFQYNYVGDCAFGVGISQRADRTLLVDNYYQWVKSRVVDRGSHTKELNPTVRDDEHYTPERGPIR